MARRFAPLSDRQQAVLQWVAQGCPDGVWHDYTYKHVAYGLAGRGLATVSRRRNAWTASLTDEGQYYVDHGHFRQTQSKTRTAGQEKPTPERSSEHMLLVTPESLLADLQAGGGIVTIPDPATRVRAAYRSAMSRAITDGLLPSGFGLRHTGRDRGDFVIRLAETHGVPAHPQPLPAIPVPETLENCLPAVTALRDSPRLMAVSDEIRERALLIAQAIAAECARRGYTFALAEDGNASFCITVGKDRFSFILFEEYDARAIPDDEKLAAARYPWQRIPSVLRDLPSGRLVLRMESDYRARSWADRQRWSIVQKLPVIFREVEAQASARAEGRARSQQEHADRRAAWEVAISRAREAHAEQLNRDRLRKQVADSAETESIRAYSSRLDSRADKCADPAQAADIREWARWARQQADRLDPLLADFAGFVEPGKVSPVDLEPFMPRGLSAWHPPD